MLSSDKKISLYYLCKISYPALRFITPSSCGKRTGFPLFTVTENPNNVGRGLKTKQ